MRRREIYHWQNTPVRGRCGGLCAARGAPSPRCAGENCRQTPKAAARANAGATERRNMQGARTSALRRFRPPDSLKGSALPGMFASRGGTGRDASRLSPLQPYGRRHTTMYSLSRQSVSPAISARRRRRGRPARTGCRRDRTGGWPVPGRRWRRGRASCRRRGRCLLA